MNRTPEQIYDELLVLRSQAGDSHAFEQLVARWQERLWWHAFRLTEQKEAASDVLQDAWMAIVRGIRRLDDPASFGSWSYRIVTNKCADWTRKQQRQRLAMQEVAAQSDEQIQADPNKSNDQQDEIQKLRTALKQLPLDRRAILSMLYLDGLSLHQIAEVLEIPIGTVKSRLHAARTELRSVLERTNDE
ncbi:MAG: RNA polymerase sigma factor (sigma-70 family) [Pirellulaceae bacterium]|jgi:RNA polymerase sigma factor (sigma-70 family)